MPNTHTTDKRKRHGISKAQGYAANIFTFEYDLHGMIEAYGKDVILQTIQDLEKFEPTYLAKQRIRVKAVRG